MGNQIILKDNDFTAEQALALFVGHFPNASHRSLVWDIPNMQKASIPPEYAALECKHDSVDALVLTGALRRVDVPDGIMIRPLGTETDWAAALDLSHDIGVEDGYETTGYRTYLETRIAGRKAQIAKGLGQWFAAFDGDELVGQMGIFHNNHIARYQSVETRMSHRKRGICSAVLRHVALWALGRAPAVKVVIVAEIDSDAGRLYRSMGFEHAETIHGVIRAGD